MSRVHAVFTQRWKCLNASSCFSGVSGSKSHPRHLLPRSLQTPHFSSPHSSVTQRWALAIRLFATEVRQGEESQWSPHIPLARQPHRPRGFTSLTRRRQDLKRNGRTSVQCSRNKDVMKSNVAMFTVKIYLDVFFPPRLLPLTPSCTLFQINEPCICGIECFKFTVQQGRKLGLPKKKKKTGLDKIISVFQLNFFIWLKIN